MKTVTISGVGTTGLAMSVETRDPLTYTLRWKNNTLAPDTSVLELIAPCPVGEGVPGSCYMGFSHEGTSYIWCFVGIGHTQSQGETLTTVVRTYAYPGYLSKTTTFNVYTAITEYTYINSGDYLYLNLGNGSRLVGFRERAFWNQIYPKIYQKMPYAERTFYNALTLSPQG